MYSLAPSERPVCTINRSLQWCYSGSCGGRKRYKQVALTGLSLFYNKLVIWLVNSIVIPMIYKIVTVISVFAFIACCSCQSDSKDTTNEIQTSHKSVDSLTTNDVSQFQQTHLHCLLDSLNLNDTLYITYVSMGCFHHSIDSIKIYYQTNNLYANLTFQDFGYKGIHKLTTYLADSSINAYIKFEKFVQAYKPIDDNSTDQESYTINYKSTSIGFECSDPDMREFDKLLFALFGKTKVDQLFAKIYHVHKNK